jgi:hypothetical protein
MNFLEDFVKALGEDTKVQVYMGEVIIGSLFVFASFFFSHLFLFLP